MDGIGFEKDAWSNLVESLLKIANQIGFIFEADRDSDEAIGDACSIPDLL